MSGSQSHLSFSFQICPPNQASSPSLRVAVGGGGILTSPCISLGHILGSQHEKEDRLGDVPMAWWLTTVKRSVTSLRPFTPGSSADGKSSSPCHPDPRGRGETGFPCPALSPHAPLASTKQAMKNIAFVIIPLSSVKLTFSGYTAVQIVLTHIQVHVMTITISTKNSSIIPPPQIKSFSTLFSWSRLPSMGTPGPRRG